MRLVTPAPPRQRDWEIYEAVIAQSRTQRDVAKQFSLSQARISQIIAKLRRWLVKGVRWDDNLPVQHQRYLILYEMRAKLEHDYTWQRGLVEQAAGPQVEVKRQLNNGVVIEHERQTKFGTVPAGQFKELRLHRLSVLDLQLQECDAKAAFMQVNQANAIWMEDALATQVVRYIRTLCKLCEKMQSIGARLTPLPVIDWPAIERGIRANHRQQPQATKINMVLPPEWRQISDEVFYFHAPLRELRLDDPQWAEKLQAAEEAALQALETDFNMPAAQARGLSKESETDGEQPVVTSLSNAETRATTTRYLPELARIYDPPSDDIIANTSPSLATKRVVPPPVRGTRSDPFWMPPMHVVHRK
jgi:hypothetical protein